MEQKTYHGKITPQELAQVLVGRFNTADMSATVSGEGAKLIVHLEAGGYSGGQTSLAVGLAPVADGVTITVGDQNLLGVAADLLQSGLKALWNPVTIIGEIDDVARNVERLNLPQQVWETVDHYCQSVGAGLTPELSGVTCPYCGVLNPLGTGQCPQCGAPLGQAQPITCPQCGKTLPPHLKFCTRCGTSLVPTAQKPATPTAQPILAKFG